jgi:hypothetical protein
VRVIEVTPPVPTETRVIVKPRSED